MGMFGPSFSSGSKTRLFAVALIAVLALAVELLSAPQPVRAAGPCGPPVVNPVACENSKTGNPASEWDVSGSGSSTIQGFATQISVNVGEVQSFKVQTTATAYRLDIYRMGYYAGNGARKVATVNPSARLPQSQPACLTQSSTGLIDCGNWAVSASWQVPADAVSGIYFAKLVRTDGTTGASHVFFVVRNDASTSDILFQTSDTTWQAYNSYGGNSLYTGQPAGRAYKVSYNRPFVTRDGETAEDFVFNSEYPMVRYLESNGYDVSYMSGADTDRRGSLIKNHKVFASVGHDEYWSAAQRANVEAARDAGVNLAFFSGNEMFWKTRWESSIDGSGTAYRTLVTYKETHANAVIDPADPPTWTGTWRDPRFSPPADGGRPENAVTGQLFMVNCCQTNMKVTAEDGKLRFWRNTRVASLAAGQTTTLGTNILGYEWDVDADNAVRPAGIMRMSTTTSTGEVLQDYGSTYASGQSATHHLTLYRAASGALVFGAGSIQYAWGLDSTHDRGSGAADSAVQQATMNLLADMGAQPATRASGLVAATMSTDTSKPTSTITSPATGATVASSSPVTVKGTASDAGGGRVGGVEVSTDGGATWHPADSGRETWSYTFVPNVNGQVNIRTRAVDDSGNLESPSAGVTITVGSGGGGGGSTGCPCTIWDSSAVPKTAADPDPSAVEVGVKFRTSVDGVVSGIRFYKGSGNTGTHVGHLWSSTGTLLGTVTFSGESASGWQQATFASPIAVTANTTYVASYYAPSGRYAVDEAYLSAAAITRGPLTALRDGTDGPNGVYRYGSGGGFPTSTYNASNYWVDVVFDTAGQQDTTPPTVTSVAPASGATGVATSTKVSAVFSEPVTASTVAIELRDPSNALVAGTAAYDAGTQTVTFTPSAALAAGTYTAKVSGAKDAAGNTMAPYSWSFTTSTVDTTPPAVTGVSPVSGATGVAMSTKVSATFSEPVTASTVTFALKTTSGGVAVSGSSAYDAGTQTVTFTPSAALAAGTSYTATVSGAKDAAGNTMAAYSWSFTTASAAPPSGCPCTIWDSTATPKSTSDEDPSMVELGVKFRASSDGVVTGIRFYKGSGNTGTHVGHLWSSTGTLLGTVTFSGETASGWQQASFATPIAVTANTTYVASYYAPSGHYAVDNSYFTSATTRGPLTALANGTDGPNGVYLYKSGGGFPTSTYNSSNYWVDVVYDTTGTAPPDTTPPTVTTVSPLSGATGVATSTKVSAVFSEPVTASTVAFELRTSSNALVAGTAAYDAGTQTVTFTPSAALAAGTFTAKVSGAKDAAGNTMAPYSWSFTTATSDTTPPAITSVSPASGATGVATSTKASATFSEPVTASTVTFALKTTSGGVAVSGSSAYDAGTQTVTFTSSAALAAGTSYTANVSGAKDAAGNTMTPYSWSFTTAAAPPPSGCPCTIWDSSAVPKTAADPDPSAVEVGVKFRTSVDGVVSGIRFYKGSGNTGTHVGHLWSSTGTLLGTVTFSGETSSGWQQASFATPIAVKANTTYVASYYAPSGHYAVDNSYFTSATTRGPLTALANGTDGPNGVYLYKSGGGFPTSTYNSSNYWVDVVYDIPGGGGPDTTPPSVTSTTPGSGASGVIPSSSMSATFSEPVTASTISFGLKTTTGGTTVSGSSAYDNATRTATFTPSAALAASTGYTATVSGAKDAAGNTMSPFSWTFTTAAPAPPPPTGGTPLAVVTSSSNPFSSYMPEILRAEGLNAFDTIPIGSMSASALASHDVVVLGEMSLTAAQVSTLTDWVNAGGRLIAMRPSSGLSGLLGLTAATGTLADAYLQVNTSRAPGAGIFADTMQFHGAADRYTTAGATVVATLYSGESVATSNPAVTLRQVGSNGGYAAAFTYDLAKSVVYTRQGNPAWAGQERDGTAPIRSDDLFFGGSSKDWIDFSKVAVPQADEQQRLLANLIEYLTADRKPLPRLWYLPNNLKAVVVSTSDDHGNGGTIGRVQTYLNASPAGCSVIDWQCPRFTAYTYPSGPLTNSLATSYVAQGFEIAAHPQNGCTNFTATSLRNSYTSELNAWRTKFPGLPSPVTNRFHCMVWSDWASQPKTELANGIRLDMNYYYWPGSWIKDRPGFMTGSGFPMRFADTDGTTIDVYQGATVVTDESGQSYPSTLNALLDNALGPEGFYGAFVANMHADLATTPEFTSLFNTALSRNVPLITAKQLLTWLDGRNSSTITDVGWNAGTLGFTITAASGARNMTSLLPTAGPGGTSLAALYRDGQAISLSTSTVKGISYASFAASSGNYTATYR